MMILRSPCATAFALLLAAAGCTAPAHRHTATADKGQRQCFFPSQISGFTHAGRDRIRVSTGPREVYEFELLGPCPDIPYSEALAFDTRGSTMICSGLDVTLIVPAAIGPRRCPVRMIRRLTEVEAKAR